MIRNKTHRFDTFGRREQTTADRRPTQLRIDEHPSHGCYYHRSVRIAGPVGARVGRRYPTRALDAPFLSKVSWWQWFTVLSLDAPAVTVAWEWLFAHEAGARLHWWHYVIVGLSVWMAYAADRWLESRRIPAERLVTARHRFYHRHQRSAGIAWVALLITTVALSFARLRSRELIWGLLLLLPTLAYVLSHQFIHRHRRWRVPKELCIALLVTAGAALFPAADARADPARLAEGAAWFFALALSNCALISVWEQAVDRQQDQDSLMRHHPSWSPAVRAFPWVLAALAVALLATRVPGPSLLRGCAAASAGLLGVLDRAQPRLGRAAAHALADAVLFTPALGLLLTRFGW